MNDRTHASLPATRASGPHLFIVEDDDALRHLLGDYFQQQSLAVTLLARADELEPRVSCEAPDLILMDIGLPGLNGLDACHRLRQAGHQTPVILLTARSDEVDRVLGLEMGADDYLVKPFSTRELLARVRAALRRAKGVSGQTTGATGEVTMGTHVLDIAARSLRRGGESRVLNGVEYALLAELAQAPLITLSREHLLAVSHHGDGMAMPRAIDAAIMRLRKMLEPDPARPRYIQTVRGQGYVFVP